MNAIHGLVKVSTRLRDLGKHNMRRCRERQREIAYCELPNKELDFWIGLKGMDRCRCFGGVATIMFNNMTPVLAQCCRHLVKHHVAMKPDNHNLVSLLKQILKHSFALHARAVLVND